MDKNFKLRFSDDFKKIVIDEENSDNNIEDYIIKHISSIVLINNSNYYCPICLRKIDNLYCDKCNINYDKRNHVLVDIDKIRNLNCYSFIYFNYFVFNVYLEHVYIKKYEVTITYVRDRSININLKDQFEVTDRGVYSDNNDKMYLYKDLEKFYDGDVDYFETFDFFNEFNNSYLYVDNLDLLKDTILYKYTFLWNIKDYLRYRHISLYDITYTPIINKEFEYLIKLCLYELAFSNSIKYNGNFENTFGLSKDYYEFMKESNISDRELSMLKLIKIKDKELIHLMSKDEMFYQELSDEVNLNDLNNYIDIKNTNIELLHRYYAYLKNVKSLGFDTKDKSVLFPTDFEQADKEIYKKKILLEEKDIDSKIYKRSEELSKYIIDDYIIFAPSSLEEFIEESKMMHNCVRDYVSSYIKGESDIYFMRKKDERNKSLITIEIKDSSINQAYAHYNMDIPEELKVILDKFQNEIKQK